MTELRARRRSSGSRGPRAQRSLRSTEHHRTLTNPNPPDRLLSDDEVAHIHQRAVDFLQEHGIRFLLPEARELLAAAGASIGVPGDDQRVRLSAQLVFEALRTAPDNFSVQAPHPSRNLEIGADKVVFLPVGGPPFVSDLDGGRRAGTLADFENFAKLTQSFDILHANTPTIEPQDVPINERHLRSQYTQLTLTDRVPFVFARGRQRVADAFEMYKLRHGLDDEAFAATPVCWTNINTNSPRQVDVPMSLGIIDFARAGQPCIMTPFTLAGAMAPVSMAGALLIQHLEVLAAVTLAQVARPGAPVMYGGFTSNVDMKSGSPAFGTPEAVQGAVATGQLARHIGLPWRSSGSSTSPIEDAQGAAETMINLQGALRGGANLVMHSAGWQEGGLCASYEKFILDVEILQIIAESWQPVVVDEAELAYDAIAEVEPGGHFFGSQHTLDRFETAFHQPLVSTRENYEQWVENGSLDARTRANAVWKQQLGDFEPPEMDDGIHEELLEFVDRRIAEGGAAVD